MQANDRVQFGALKNKHMSDTPRTDAAWSQCVELEARTPLRDLSMQLETELNEANFRIRMLLKIIDGALNEKRDAKKNQSQKENNQ